MKSSVKNGKIEQEIPVTAIPFSGGRPQRKRIISSADLDVQYSPYFALHQTITPIYTVYPGTADELVRRHGWEIYDAMMMDAQVSGCINDIVMGAINGEPRAVPSSGARQAQIMADFVNRNLDSMQFKTGIPSLEIFKQILSDSLKYGHCVAEMVFDEMNLPDGPVFMLRKLVPILPKRYAFRISLEGDVIGIVPFRFDTSAAFGFSYIGNRIEDKNVVPLAKLVYTVWNRQGTMPNGVSALAPAHKVWAIKQTILEEIPILAKRIRKSWLGKLPADARRVCITDPQTGQQDIVDPREDLLDVLRALANGEGGVVPFGSEVQDFEVEVGGAGQFFLEAMKALDRQILRAIYMRMLANNNDAAASTTGEFDSGMTSKVVKSVRNWFEASIRWLAYSLCYFTFGSSAEEYCPHIVVGRGDGMPISVKDVALLHQSSWFTRRQKMLLDEELGLPPDDGGELIGVNGDKNIKAEEKMDEEKEEENE